MKVIDKETGEELNVYDKSWALVVGINKYKEWPQLDYAVNDARSVGELLINKFGFRREKITYLFDGEATLGSIKDKLFSILQKSDKNDRVLVYFSGHGQTLDLKGGGQLGFLIPVEGSTKDDQLYSSCLSMDDIKRLASGSVAKHILFLVDACYSGLAASTQKGLPKETHLYLKKVASAKGRQIITAGGKDEESVERSEWGHGAFTYELLEGLDRGTADIDDDNVITFSELGTYLKSRVSKVSGNKQTPQPRYLTDDEGEFVFVLEEEQKTVVQTAQPEEKEPSLGTVKILYGSLEINNSIDGELFVDGKHISKVKAGTVIPVNNLTVGGHEIKIISPKGEFLQSVSIENDKILSLAIRVPTDKFLISIGASKKIELARVYASIASWRFDHMIYIINRINIGMFHVFIGDFEDKQDARKFRDEIKEKFPDDYRDAWVSSSPDEEQKAVVQTAQSEENVLTPTDGMVWVEGGWFDMGSNDGESYEKPVHRVYVDGFYMDKYEVTVAKFKQFVDATGYKTDAEKGKGSYFWTGSTWEQQSGVDWRDDVQGKIQTDMNHPVNHISWNDAHAYAQWAGKRLPTEAEWEYAARGGNKSRGYIYSGGNSIDEVAWFGGNAGFRTHPIGEKKPNELGIYDMSGNVWEWCQDWWGENYYLNSPEQNPQGPSSGTYRVLRGGSWYYTPKDERSAHRYGTITTNCFLTHGFRCVRNK
jgi:formylglycine-generating enzyme required for sulfatase activity